MKDNRTKEQLLAEVEATAAMAREFAQDAQTATKKVCDLEANLALASENHRRVVSSLKGDLFRANQTIATLNGYLDRVHQDDEMRELGPVREQNTLPLQTRRHGPMTPPVEYGERAPHPTPDRHYDSCSATLGVAPRPPFWDL